MARRVVRHEVIQPLHTSYRFIPLTQGLNAIVDAEDFEWLSEYPWYASWDPRGKSFEARTNQTRTDGSRFQHKMHRLILECGLGEEIDHRNHNTLDNRRLNLRKCTQAQNKQNKRAYSRCKSGFKGVCWKTRERRWTAQIQVSKKKMFIGYFDSKEEAARAYDVAAKQHFGEFAYLNFPMV